VIQTAAVNEARTAAYLPDGNGNFISAGPLLLEAAGTNLLLRSEEFDDTTWSTSSLTVTPDDAVAPDGSQTADLLTTTGSPGVISQTITKAASAITYTASLWVKSFATDFSVTVDGGGPANRGIAVFDLSSGSLVSASSVGAFTNTSGAITAYSNGWYRLILSTTTDTSTSARFRCFFFGAGSTATVWGAQLEASPYATSYIPTAGSQVTRAADVSDGGANTFGNSWYRQDEGTVFSSYQLPAGSAVNTNSRQLFDASDGTTANRFSIRGITVGLTSDQITARSGASTVAQFFTNGTAVGTAPRSIAAVYRLNDYAAVATGSTSTVTDTIGALPVGINQVNLGGAAYGAEYLSGTIRRLTYWPSRLPNDTLQTITL
jgi:hypothetical protein